MDVTKTLLHSGWEYAFAPSETVQTPEDCAGLSFRPATVPGVNLTDLQAAGLVEPDTSATYEDSFAPYAQMDFIYRCHFDGSEAADRLHLYLCCDGLDTVCTLYLNGQRLGDTENAHLGYRFDVVGRVHPGDNELLLLFRSPIVEANKRADAYAAAFGRALPAPHPGNFMYIRKPAYSYFWDWGPKIPVSGIYKDIYLLAYDRAEIEEYHVRYQVREGAVTGTVAVKAGGDAAGAQVRLRLAGRTFQAPVGADGRASVAFEIPEVQLWYPNGEGEPFLYDLHLQLEAEGRPLDERRQRIGFRTIELVREPRQDDRGTRFLFRVNGRDVFIRGYNWIPVDNALPRGYGRLYEGNLDLARRGNVNMLRIWGGGYYETDEFYRLCDEQGIMVWQDGAFACALYPDDDPAFLELVRQELSYNIRRLRNATSLALWCGENENHCGFEEWWYDRRAFPIFGGTHIYDELFPALLRELDPDRPYWNGSPYSEEPGVRANDAFHGDTHLWDLHSNCADFWHYRATAPSFVSETGIQSLPDLRTALTIGGPEDRHIQSFVFDTRNHFENPAKNERLLKFTGALFRVSSQFDEAVIRSNLANGEYLKYAVEHWRSQAYDCAGVLIWQLNDCWPAISWAAVDYNLQPKASWYYLQRAYASDLVGYLQNYSIDYDPEQNARGELFVASEREGTKTGVVEMQAMTVTGEVFATRHYPVALDGRGAVSLGPLALPDYKARRFEALAVLTLRWDDGSTVRNIYTYSRPKHMRLPEPQIRALQLDATRFKLRSDIFAKGVYLFHRDMAVVFDDNYFDLLPGEEKTIAASAPVQISEIKAIAYHH
ncbi:MAG: beta-mannosidase [Anaerolineae bacterium]